MERIEVKMQYDYGTRHWVANFNGVLAAGRTWPEASDALIKQLFTVQDQAIAAEAPLASDVADFCYAQRHEKGRICWVTLPAAFDGEEVVIDRSLS